MCSSNIPKVEYSLDQRDRLVHKGLLVGHDRENHADRQLSGQRHHDGKIDRHNVFEAEDGFVQRAEQDLRAADPHRGIDDPGIAVQPLAFAFVFAIEQFERLNRAQGFDQRRVFLRLAADDGLAALAELTVKRQAERQIKQKRRGDNQAQNRAIDKDHGKRDKRPSARR